MTLELIQGLKRYLQKLICMVSNSVDVIKVGVLVVIINIFSPFSFILNIFRYLPVHEFLIWVSYNPIYTLLLVAGQAINLLSLYMYIYMHKKKNLQLIIKNNNNKKKLKKLKKKPYNYPF